MNTAKVYLDSDGNECSIVQMVEREPTWAASRIQEGEKAFVALLALSRAFSDWPMHVSDEDEELISKMIKQSESITL